MTSSNTLYRMRAHQGGLFLEYLEERLLPFRWKEQTLYDAVVRANNCQFLHQNDHAFDLAFAVLMLTNSKAAAFFDLTGESRSINTRYNPASLRDTFRKYAKNFNQQALKKGEDKIHLNFERLTVLFSDAYGPIRRGLGWSDPLPSDYYYKITADVVAATENEGCREALDSLATRHQYIFPDIFEKLVTELSIKFPEEKIKVTRALKATKSRDLLSSLSVADVRGDTMVCIANHHKQRLRLEDWKFLALLDDPNSPKMIARLERTDYREKTSPFIFGDLTTGDVHAVFKPSRSTIHVVCQREEDRYPGGRAEFIIDPDLALCIYMLLSRLKQDKKEFTRLWEEANIHSDYNPFENQFNSEEDLL